MKEIKHFDNHLGKKVYTSGAVGVNPSYGKLFKDEYGDFILLDALIFGNNEIHKVTSCRIYKSETVYLCSDEEIYAIII